MPRFDPIRSVENEEAEKMAGGGSASSSSATKGPKKKKSTAATARKLRVNPSPPGEPGTAQCWEVMVPKSHPVRPRRLGRELGQHGADDCFCTKPHLVFPPVCICGRQGRV